MFRTHYVHLWLCLWLSAGYVFFISVVICSLGSAEPAGKAIADTNSVAGVCHQPAPVAQVLTLAYLATTA